MRDGTQAERTTLREQRKAALERSLLRIHPDATSYSGLSRTTLYSLMDSGKLAYVKLGKCRRIPVAALETLISDHLIQKTSGGCCL